MMLRKLLVSFICVCVCTISFAQTQRPVYLSQAVASGTVKGFYEYLPGDYASTTKNYPVIIWVHGAGQGGQGNTTDLPKVLQYGLPKNISESGFPASFNVNGENFSFIIISPQFTTGWPNGTMLTGFVNYLMSVYRIDPDRIYLMGMSAGGGAVWDCASMNSTNSNRFGAIIPFCGAFAPTQARANTIAAGKLPVWTFHNTNDGTVPVQQSRNWVNYINAYSPAYTPAARLTEFPVVSSNAVIAHDSWSTALNPNYKPNGLNIYEWLLQYKRRVSTANALPSANAGTDQGVVLPADVILDGSLSSDPDGVIVSYRWRKTSGPSSYSFIDSTVVKPTVRNLVSGVYQFELRVTDNIGAVSTDLVTVNVYPAIPSGSQQRVLIDIGADPGRGGVLTSNPSINGNTWNNVTSALPGVRLSNAVSVSNVVTGIGLEVINRIDGTFSTSQPGIGSGNNSVVVGDYPGSATTDHALVHYSATNGKWKIFGLDPARVYSIKFWGARTNTTATRAIEIKRADNNVWLTYNATGNTNFNNAAVFNITGVPEMTFDIRTKAGSDFSCINVVDITFGGTSTEPPPPPQTNSVPVAKAGNDISINLPSNSITLNGCQSTDAENAPLQYTWTKISGPQATIQTNTQCSTIVSGLVTGTYIFELLVKDTGNLQSTDRVTVTVNDIQPTPWPATPAPACPQPYRIVVVGSSSAYGTGATPLDSAWANKFRKYLQLQNSQVIVTNIATPSLTSYEVLPTGFVPPANRPQPNPERNITKALSYSPDAIIINLPSNDIANGYTLQECKDNFNRLAAASDAANVPVWITTTQPRDRLSPAEKSMQLSLRDWIISHFGNKSVDFWTTVGNADGTMNPFYNAGDSIHLNNYGHHILFTRIAEEKIWDTICARRTVPPVARAGNDQTVQLPQSDVFVDGRLSSDANGMIVSYNWSIVNGPSGAQIVTPSKDTTTFNFTSSGTYNLRLTVTDNDGLTSTDDIMITVLAEPVPNQLPTANAGPDKTIQLPSRAFVDGRASGDADGTITSYQWAVVSGPGSAQVLTPNKDTTSISFSTAGSYIVRLLVTDNSGGSDSDEMTVSVVAAPPPPPAGDKTVKVNIFGGSNPYSNSGWNNWSISAGSYSSNFLYDDGTSSTINAMINTQAGIADNGASYAASATICPPAVLRYNSYNTSIRTLTIRGLDPSRRYYMEFYGSRANSGNATIVTVNGTADTISTDNNSLDYAKFYSIAPTANGSVSVTLMRIGTYNYLAGFIIREADNAGRGKADENVIAFNENNATLNKVVSADPNPFTSSLNIRIKESAAGPFNVRITDVYGRQLFKAAMNAGSNQLINTSAFAPGVYIVSVLNGSTIHSIRVVKQ